LSWTSLSNAGTRCAPDGRLEGRRLKTSLFDAAAAAAGGRAPRERRQVWQIPRIAARLRGQRVARIQQQHSTGRPAEFSRNPTPPPRALSLFIRHAISCMRRLIKTN